MKKDDIKFIREHLTKRDMYEALAEESSELAQAALKYIRAYKMNNNYTPKKEIDADNSLSEEIMDVLICLYVLGIHIPTNEEIANNFKISRWANRLNDDIHFKEMDGVV